MIPVSKIDEFHPSHVGQLVSYRRGYCVGFIASSRQTLACNELVRWALENGITFPDYSETIPVDGFGWNRIEYAMLSLTKDVIHISGISEEFQGDEIYLVNPYLIWYLGTQVFEPDVPYPNIEQPLEAVLQNIEYLQNLFIAGKREGWYECIYRYNNKKERIVKTANNFVSVKSPKVLESGDVAPMLVSISKKPWFPYRLEREEHVISTKKGFYVAVCYGGYVQFIAEMGAYLEESKCEELSGCPEQLTPEQLDVCCKMMGHPVTELL